jgi:hypothetical protein
LEVVDLVLVVAFCSELVVPKPKELMMSVVMSALQVVLHLALKVAQFILKHPAPLQMTTAVQLLYLQVQLRVGTVAACCCQVALLSPEVQVERYLLWLDWVLLVLAVRLSYKLDM